ncbi:glutathione-dependent disulfide-bond oxidoreductase [Erythrobacter sp. THAF29]|uniref:glutathione-dependent disulfide-bond oxidoreductase n=1 Tax=Erythrobacter sp. THAF29 TaxID=2587851 RepID=UPI0012692113|nr:glutathione-dependent disulfide-bond oxidoreductase [Erythrobacter sp. THAF29]QFT78316.1 Disulfide-bond oxidoreductase YghU [Erythrobacter sp. THAF29]
MADPTYTPPEVWSPDTESGGRFASINRPTSGAREEKELPVGKHPFQLYSLATPNGVKVTIMFEELLELGHKDAEYDAFTINIGEGEQFTSGFVAINPNSKIPALVDRSGDKPFRIFESGAILVHLAEKFGEFLPTEPAARAETLSWLFWQVGTGPFIGGGFGHFYAYAPEKYEYPINRYAMETKRIFDVADKRLAETRFLAGDEYTIADMANFPWLAPFVFGNIYNEAKRFLSIDEYENVARWVYEINERPAVQRGKIVNKVWGDDEATQLRERHSAADFEGKKLR